MMLKRNVLWKDRSSINRNTRRNGFWVGAGLLLGIGATWHLAATWAPGPGMGPHTGMRASYLPDVCSVLSPAWAMPAADRGEGISVVIDDFETAPIGGFPPGWKAWRGDTDEAKRVYRIQEENGNRYLAAEDDGASIIIRKELRSWNPREYPILSWRWRARKLPKGGDERIGEKNDSAVAVYVVLDQNFFHIPKTLKYVWSTTLPAGTEHRRGGIGRPHVIVLQSGPETLRQWVTESVNVYEDFIRVFGKEPPDKAVGIGVLTDGNATKSPSAGDYDRFVVHRHRDGS